MNQNIFIGNYSKGIKKFELHENGKFKYIGTIGNLENNSYITKYKDYIFSVHETQNGELVSYKNEKIYNRQGCGELPCYLTIDEKRKIIYVANYSSGSFVAFKLEEDGTIGEKLYKKQYESGSNIHHIKIYKDKLYVTNLGKNTIYEYSTNYAGKKLDVIEKSKIIFPDKTEPRHIVLNDDGDIFVVTEISCRLYKLIHDENEKLKIENNKSIIMKEENQCDEDTGCAIIMSFNKKYIYVSVRGKNVISVFDVEDMKLIQSIDCGGTCPRDISFDYTGKIFMCANQLSNNIAIYDVFDNGMLKFKETINIDNPSCIIVEKI